MSDPIESPPQSHLLQLASLVYQYSLSPVTGQENVIIELASASNMGPFLSALRTRFGWQLPALDVQIEQLVEKNAVELEKLDKAVSIAEKEQGEMEVRDALMAKADYLANIGEKEKALDAYDVALKKTIGAGPRIDVVFAKLRVLFFAGDLQGSKVQIEKAQSLIDEGGDWDRRNRLKMYSALYYIQVRDIKKAVNHLLDAVATFTTTELFPYSQFVFYLVICTIISVDRNTLREKVIKAPEVISALSDLPEVQNLLNSFFNCNYESFFSALVEITPIMQKDFYVNAHTHYFVRELRLVSYLQFLESYRSVTLASMAEAFGISIELLDSDISRFVYAGRLFCKVDKVSGVIECSRPDSKHAQYAAVIKQGDALLNRIQKLARIISY